MKLSLTNKKVLIVSDEITIKSAKKLIYKILTLDRSNGDIYLIINSCGGDKNAGPLFYKSLKSTLKNKLITIAAGEVASTATMFYLTGSVRLANEGSTFYVHAGRHQSEDGFPMAEVNTFFKSLKIEEDDWAATYAKNSNLSKKKWKKIIKKSKVFTTKEMLKYGLANQLIED